MKGFPDKGKEKRAVGYYVGKHINLTHVDGAVNAGGNDLIFDNLLNLQNGISTYSDTLEWDNDKITPNNSFILVGLSEPARRTVIWDGKLSPTFRPYSDDFTDFEIPKDVNRYYSQEEVIFYNNIKNVILIYNYLKANNYKFVILEGLKNNFNLVNKFINIKIPTFFNSLKTEFLKIKKSKEWINECYRDWIIYNSKNITYADNEETVLDYTELLRMDKHPTELGAESFANYLIENYSEKFGIKV